LKALSSLCHQKITEIHSVLSWCILAFVSIEGVPKEAILLNRVCGCGRKWHHWIREVWGYRWIEIHFHLWFLQSTIALQKQLQIVSDVAGPSP